MHNSKEGFFTRLKPLHRTFISLAMSILTGCMLPATMSLPEKLTISWAALSLTYLVLCYAVIIKLNAVDTQKKAAQEDGSRLFIMFVIVLSAIASLAAVLSLIVDDGVQHPRSMIVGVSVAVMVLSWLLVHTTFIFHYAFLYYKNEVGEGLSFPGNEAPDYMDFAYYSLCLGCTFQVSDVTITSKAIRRTTLLHSLLAFALNTFVVALTINLIAGLK